MGKPRIDIALPAGVERLRAETGLRDGPVPSCLPGALTVTPTYEISHDAFLLRLPTGLAFYYRRGTGTVCARPAGMEDREVALFFDGSVYGAIAWLNGLVPLHASAVSHDGGISAFTGGSGEGKSTLAAALARRGLAVVSDDVLVLDPSDPGVVMAVPSHKRLKLWADALLLTSHHSDARVRPGLDKFHVADGIRFAAVPLPVRRVYLLESIVNVATGITEIVGADRFAALRSAYYRPQFYGAIADHAGHFSTAARLSGAIPMARFNRSRTRAEFAAGIAMIEADIRATDA